MSVLIGYGLAGTGAAAFYFYSKKKNGMKAIRPYLLAGALVCMISLIVGIAEQFFRSGETAVAQLERAGAGEGETEVTLHLNGKSLKEDYEYQVTVAEQLLTEEEAEQLFITAQEELTECLLLNNSSAEAVSRDLVVPSSLQDGLVDVSCYFEPYDLVDVDGTIFWENLTGESAIVTVTAQLACQDYEKEITIPLQITREAQSEEEAILNELAGSLESENQKKGESVLTLPTKINGTQLSWSIPSEAMDSKVFVLGLVLLAVFYLYQRREQEQKKKKRRDGLTRDYPEIVSQLSLLSGAGMTIPAAWSLLAGDYQKREEKGKKILHPGYEEMVITMHEMQDGTGEIRAYENFGERCCLPSYRKLASLLAQNIRKGTKELQKILDEESNEAFRERLVYARQQGEEAGTKVLLPMGMMMVLVFAILMVPAMLSLGM